MAKANRLVLHGGHGTKIQFDPAGSGPVGEEGRQVLTYETRDMQRRIFRSQQVIVSPGVYGNEAKALLDTIPDFGSHWLYVFAPDVDVEAGVPVAIHAFAATVLEPVDILGRTHPGNVEFRRLTGIAQLVEEPL